MTENLGECKSFLYQSDVIDRLKEEIRKAEEERENFIGKNLIKLRDMGFVRISLDNRKIWDAMEFMDIDDVED